MKTQTVLAYVAAGCFAVATILVCVTHADYVAAGTATATLALGAAAIVATSKG